MIENGKYALIDSQLKNITPFKYDSIWSFNDNVVTLLHCNNVTLWQKRMNMEHTALGRIQ